MALFTPGIKIVERIIHYIVNIHYYHKIKCKIKGGKKHEHFYLNYIWPLLETLFYFLMLGCSHYMFIQIMSPSYIWRPSHLGLNYGFQIIIVLSCFKPKQMLQLGQISTHQYNYLKTSGPHVEARGLILTAGKNKTCHFPPLPPPQNKWKINYVDCISNKTSRMSFITQSHNVALQSGHLQ